MENIDHVIFVTLENRSFHYVLGYLEDHHDHYNYDKIGNKIYCHPVEPKSGGDGIFHDIAPTLYAIQGINNKPMTGFIRANELNVRNLLSFDGSNHVVNSEQIMGYMREGSMPVLHKLASSFCVCDRWFASTPSETFPNRDFMISATSDGRVDNLPHKFWKILYNRETIFDR